MPIPAPVSSRSLALAALFAVGVSACDIVRVPDRSSEAVSYVVTGARYNRGPASPVPLTSRIGIEYTSPTGIQTDTIIGPLVSWSKLFENGEGFTPRVTARILTPTDTLRNKVTNFVGVRLRIGQTVYADSSSDSLTVTVK